MSVSEEQRVNELADKLTASAQRALGGDWQVKSLHRLSGGASQESWRFDLQSGRHKQAMVLRRAPPGKKPRGFSTIDLDTEAKLLAVAQSVGVAVPSVRWQLHIEDDCGTGYVMDALKGETLPKKILAQASLADARKNLARQCGENLARLHALPKPQLPEMPYLSAAAQLQQLRGLYDSFGEKRPVLELAFQWLCASASDSQSQTQAQTQGLVHGDFRNGNLMVDEDGLRAVLDWELAHLGDPMEDLGWLTVTSWRFGEIDKPVGGFGGLDDLFAGYEAVSGSAVNAEQVQFWQALGTLKWGIICLLQAFTHLSGQRRSVELAAIGTRVSEAEIDLLQIMAPRESLEKIELPRNASGCRPTAAELAQAVAEYLNNDVIPALDGRPAFHAKVTANMLGVIERQELLGPAVDAAQTQRLQTLLGQQGSATELNNTLCQHIRDAKLGLDTPALLDHLWTSTSERLVIDQPQYATYQRLITPK